MPLFQDFLDQSKQCNQAPISALPYHAQHGRYQIIHQALNLPELPAPLHYLNFFSVFGLPKSLLCQTPSQITSPLLDTALVFSSTSAAMHAPYHYYPIAEQCYFDRLTFQFAEREKLTGSFPHFQLQRDDAELSYHLSIQTTDLVSYFTKLRFGLAEHWSVMCHCQGDIYYQGQNFNIDQLGSFDYARAVNLPYFPIAFLTYQMMNLSGQRQLIVMQTRDQFNHILQSKLYLRDLRQATSELIDQHVHFKIHRVYPKVMTPHGQSMYLPREFEWNIDHPSLGQIQIQAQSRGDFKFGLMAGYAGSFYYQLNINGQLETGQAGYCEYIDCRPLIWQEHNKSEKTLQNWAYPELVRLKDAI